MESYMARLHDDVDEHLQAFYKGQRANYVCMTDLTNCGSVDNETEGKDEISETEGR